MRLTIKSIILMLLLPTRGWASPVPETFYTTQAAWQNLQQRFPIDYRLDNNTRPQEYFWPWQQHKIHVDYYPKPKARAKVILLHGVGTNGRQMTLVLGHPLAEAGYETMALDLPGYGLSQISNKKAIVYEDWIKLVNDFIHQEAAKDPRPIFLYGLSAGGMLGLHVAMQNTKVRGVIGMTFLDQRDPMVRKGSMRFSALSGISLASLKLSAKTPLKNLSLPMRWVSKMQLLSNDPEALKIMLADKTSAGNRMSLKFLNSYMNAQPNIDISAFKHSPVLLTQPEHDRWTPLALSQPVLMQLQVPYHVVLLPQGGHYPVEAPALAQLKHSSIVFIEDQLKSINAVQRSEH